MLIVSRFSTILKNKIDSVETAFLRKFKVMAYDSNPKYIKFLELQSLITHIHWHQIIFIKEDTTSKRRPLHTFIASFSGFILFGIKLW